MAKKWIRAFAVLVFLAFLWTVAGEGTIFGGGNDASIIESEIIETENDGGIQYSEYDCLNDSSLLYSDFRRLATRELLQKGMAVMSEELKGEFIPVVPEDCSFPEELVVIMEDIFYNSASFIERNKDNSYFDEKLRELGSEEFEMKDIDERNKIIELYGGFGALRKCVASYRFHLTEGTDNYLFVTSYTGSSNIEDITVYLMEKVGNTVIELHSFQTESRGELIHYDGEFYFITWEENDVLGMYEGIRIRRLNGNPQEETLCIRYLPDEYVWSTCYSDYDSTDSSDTPATLAQKEKKSADIHEYLEQMKKEFANGRYLREEEEDLMRTKIYYGDEKDGESLKLDDNGRIGYKVDIANCGLPVYVSKEMIWEGLHYSENLETRFFYYDPVEKNFKELEKLSLYSQQLWFKEIEGNIYVCRILHICDFNYSFEITLLEKNGDKVEDTLIYSATVVPKRKFVVTEGPVYITRLMG